MITNEVLERKELLSNFQDLIHPFKLETFTEKYWEQEPLIIQRKDDSYYDSLFSITNVDELLDLHRPTGGSIRVVRNQIPLTPSKYENPDGSLNLNQLYAAYGDGHTIVVNEIDRFWKPLKNLCQHITMSLSHSTVANMYLTPKNQKALSPHYDTHDVYVVQVHGTKHWKIYDADYPTPLVNSFQPVFQREQLQNERDITLHAGDLMYIPRGVPHEATTTDESSLHLTLGVYPVQWMDLLVKSLYDLARTHLEFRQALPIGFLNKNKENNSFTEAIESKLQDLLEVVSNNANASVALQYLGEDFRMKHRPNGDGHFDHLDQMDEIDLDTSLIKRQNMYCSIQQVDTIARILYPGNVIRGPVHITPALQYIAEARGAFRISQIPSLSDKNKVKLAKRLIRGGLLKITEGLNNLV